MNFGAIKTKKKKKINSVVDSNFYKENKDSIEEELKILYSSDSIAPQEDAKFSYPEPKIKQREMTEKDKIIEIFFGIQSGELPEEYLPLKERYLKDKESIGSECSNCQLNGLINQYRNKIVRGDLN